MTCFMIGFLFGVNKNFSKENPSQNVWYFKKDKFKILACFVLFAISSGIYYLFNCNYNTLLPNFIEYFANGVSVAIMGVTFSIIFLSLFKFLNNKQLPKVLTFIDSTSYHFYITHHAFVVSSGNLLYSLNLTNFVWLNIILAFIFSMLSAYLLKCISNLVLKNIKKLTLLK